MADDIGGVWRTIGGRRVFIRTGTTLQQAMKESGKFKNLGKKVKEKKRAEDDKKFKEKYKSAYDNLKETNPQLSEEEIISILRARQYNGELHADIEKGSQNYFEEKRERLEKLKGKISNEKYEELKKGLKNDAISLKELEGYEKTSLVNQIKNYDNPGVLVDKWSAEEQFLARMKSGYDYAKEKEGKDKAEQYLKGVNVIEKSDDYLLYSMKNPNDGYTRYEISNSYDKNDRGKVEVFVEEDYSNGTIAGLSVNWSAIGSVDADTAKRFAEKINKAAEFADKAGKKVKGKKRWL